MADYDSPEQENFGDSLNPALVFALLKSSELFPIDFDDAWQWVGWTRKSTAKEILISNFVESVDFCRKGFKSPNGGRPSEWILLTVDCFKSLAMMAGTPKGRRIRQYFLSCEAELKRKLEQEQETHKKRVIRAVVDDQPSHWTKRYEDDFFSEAYRITGWKKTAKGHPPCMGNFINKAVYDYFPEGVPEQLRKVNPRNSNGHRSRKHHQHLTPFLGLTVLDAQKAVTVAVMRLSPPSNLKRFEQNMQKACGSTIQVEIPFTD